MNTISEYKIDLILIAVNIDPDIRDSLQMSSTNSTTKDNVSVLAKSGQYKTIGK